MPGQRELLDTGTSKRYIRRDDQGRFTTDQVDVGRSLAADQRQTATGHGQARTGRPRRPQEELERQLRRSPESSTPKRCSTALRSTTSTWARSYYACAMAAPGRPSCCCTGIRARIRRGIAWRPLLADAFTVVCPDLRGYGESSKPPDEPDHGQASKRAMAGDAVALMQALGHARFAVVGHDRGAYAALRTALDHPAAVTHLAILDAVPIGEALRTRRRALRAGVAALVLLRSARQAGAGDPLRSRRPGTRTTRSLWASRTTRTTGGPSTTRPRSTR